MHDGARCCARETAWQAGALARLRRQGPVRFMKVLYTSCLGPPPMPSISFPSPAPPVASRPLDAVVIRHCVRVLLVGRVAQHLVSRKPPILRRSNVPITRRTRGPNRCADRCGLERCHAGLTEAEMERSTSVIALCPNFFPWHREPCCEKMKLFLVFSPPSSHVRTSPSYTALGHPLGGHIPGSQASGLLLG